MHIIRVSQTLYQKSLTWNISIMSNEKDWFFSWVVHPQFVLSVVFSRQNCYVNCLLMSFLIIRYIPDLYFTNIKIFRDLTDVVAKSGNTWM